VRPDRFSLVELALKQWPHRPVIGVLYILNYIDRQNLSAAKVQGIKTDLNLTTQQFATAVSILFGELRTDDFSAVPPTKLTPP
jgi:hypothetical protein